MKPVNSEQLKEVLALATKRKNEILGSKSEYPTDGTVYYVDCELGSDDNDGLTPETALRGIDGIEFLNTNPGDTILFKRGQIFRGCLHPRKYVTYSAYGEGPKPIFCNSIDASDPNDWVKTDAENVWMFKPMIAFVKDVGSVVINGGQLWGIKICENTITGDRCDMYRQNGRRDETARHGELDVWNGRRFVHRESTKFNGYKDIKGDLEFFHRYQGHEHLYLHCADGNPGKVFDSIELTLRHYAVHGNCTGCTFDNISFKYANFGIAASGSNDFVVRNCEFGWIGGCSQFPEMYAAKNPNTPFGSDVTRLGNGIEIWGDCKNFTIENCYFEQIYDAAVTVQISRSTAERDYVIENMKWINNVFDTCQYCFELWLSIGDRNGFRHEMNNIDISGNICLNSGYGWAHQRPDPGYTFYYGSLKSAATADFKNCNLNNNYFINGRGSVFSAYYIGGSKMQFFDNKIYHNKSLGALKENFDESMENVTYYSMREEDIEKVKNSGFVGNNEYYGIAESDIPEGNIIKF